MRLKLSFMLLQIVLVNLCLAQSKPNIVFILADDPGYNIIGTFGQKFIRTTNIDVMAKNGMHILSTCTAGN